MLTSICNIGPRSSIFSDLSVADKEGAADDADNQTPKKVVEIDLTASPEVCSSSASPPGTNHGCSVCLDSLRDIR